MKTLNDIIQEKLVINKNSKLKKNYSKIVAELIIEYDHKDINDFTDALEKIGDFKDLSKEACADEDFLFWSDELNIGILGTVTDDPNSKDFVIVIQADNIEIITDKKRFKKVFNAHNGDNCFYDIRPNINDYL